MMKIKIRDDARKVYIAQQMTPGLSGVNWEWADKLEIIQGQTLEVETEHLFGDQFNTGPIDGVSDSGMRIMAALVEKVIDDDRPGKMRCAWCGSVNEVSEICPSCERSDHIFVFDMTHHDIVAHMSRLS